MSSRGSTSLPGEEIKLESLLNEGQLSCSEFLARYKDWKRDHARKEELRKELKFLEQDMEKQDENFEALLATQKELSELWETISDEELIEKFRKMFELLGYSIHGMLLADYEEPRLLLKLEFDRLRAVTLAYYQEGRFNYLLKINRLLKEFNAITDKLEKDGEFLNKFGTCLERSLKPLITQIGKCADRNLERQREILKMGIESGSFDLNVWIVKFLGTKGMTGRNSEMKYKIERTCWGSCVPRWELNTKLKKRRDEREDFVKGYDVPSEEYCGNCFKAHIFNVLRLDDLVDLIISINF